MVKKAIFKIGAQGFYYPHNRNAVTICAILSRMRLRKSDMISVKSHGYEPVLADGELLEIINITA